MEILAHGYQTKDQEYYFTIQITPEEWEDCLTKAIRKVGKNIKLAGYRTGHIPINVLKTKLNPDSYVQKAVQYASDGIIQNLPDQPTFIENLDRFWQTLPQISVSAFAPEQDNYQFQLVYQAYPKLSAIDYKQFKVDASLKKVDQKAIAAETNLYLTKHAVLEPKTGAKPLVANGDVVLLDFVGTINNEPFEGGSAQNYELKIGSKSFIDNFEEQLVGLSIGAKKDVLVTFPNNYHVASLAGQKAQFAVTINAINTPKLPKLDDAFVASLNIKDVTTVQALEKHITNQLEQRYLGEQKQRIEQQVKEAIIASVVKQSVKIPQPVIDQYVQHSFNNLMNSLQINKKNNNKSVAQLLQELHIDQKQLVEHYTKTAIADLQLTLGLETIAKNTPALELDENRLAAVLTNLAQSQNCTVKDLQENLQVYKTLQKQVLNQQLFEQIKNHFTTAKPA